MLGVAWWAFATTRSASVRSLTLDRMDAPRRRSKASSTVTPVRAAVTPIAWSMTARRSSAWRICRVASSAASSRTAAVMSTKWPVISVTRTPGPEGCASPTVASTRSVPCASRMRCTEANVPPSRLVLVNAPA